MNDFEVTDYTGRSAQQSNLWSYVEPVTQVFKKII
jgi:hypothetical protein